MRNKVEFRNQGLDVMNTEEESRRFVWVEEKRTHRSENVGQNQ